VRLEDADGRLIVPLGALGGFTGRKFRFEAPAGRFRPVLRGNMTFADGPARPFVVRGALCEGLTEAEVAEIRAREEPPKPPAGGRRIAVWTGGIGAPDLIDAFNAGLNLRAFPLHHLRPDHLATAEVLVLSQAHDVEELSPAAVQAVRQWVASGGVLILTHDAVGARWHPRMFPEVGVGADFSRDRDLLVMKAIGEFKVEDALEHAYDDHVRIAPAPAAEVLLREATEKGAPVLVAGPVGKGRVILYGAAPGYGSREMSDRERALLWALAAGGR
jgi:hypothetical protein